MRILVLQLKRIGDLILTTPALWALRQNLPRPTSSSPSRPGPARCSPPSITWTRPSSMGATARIPANWRHLLLRHYDVCLDFTGTDRSALFAVLSKASRRVTFEWVQRSRFRHVFYNEFIASSVRENHTVDHYLHLLRALNLPIPRTPPSSSTSPSGPPAKPASS